MLYSMIKYIPITCKIVSRKLLYNTGSQRGGMGGGEGGLGEGLYIIMTGLHCCMAETM